MFFRGLLFGLYFLTSNTCAQTSKDAEIQAGGDRPFTVSVVGATEPSLVYGDRLVMAVRITSKAEMKSIGQVDLKPLGNLEAIYSNNSEPCTLSGISKATPNVPFILSCTLSTDSNFSSDILHISRLSKWLLTPGTQKVLLTIGASKVGKDDDKTYLEEIPISFSAPLGVIFLGGLAGALLLAMFSGVKEGLESKAPKLQVNGLATIAEVAKRLAEWVLNLLPRVWKAILQTIMGGICAVILILLARGTEGLSPPVSIKIQDFWGGVIVGLFSIPLSQWIWTHIQPKGDTQDKGTPPAGKPNDKSPTGDTSGAHH